MSKPSMLLLAACFAGVFGVTSWWLMRGDAEKAADAEVRSAETVVPLANNPVPGKISSDPQPPALTSAAHSPDISANPAGVSPAEYRARREADLEQLRNGQQQEELRRQDPEYRQRQDEDRRRSAERYRADAIRIAGMTDAEVDQMFEFGMQKTTAIRSLIAASYGRPAEEVFAEARRLEDEYQEKLQGFLEPRKYERWQWYQASQGERNEANQFSRSLTREGGEALQPGQVDTLVEALYAEERRWEKEYNEYMRSTGLSGDKVPPRSNEYQLASGKARNQRIHDAMAGTLNPSQLASLDRMLAGKLTYIENAIRYNESLGKTK